ncbi:MAG: ZIP family metal transporter [Chloroflexota bacterium]
MLTTLIIGLATSSALWIGALLGAYWKPPQWLVGLLIAFASGALITALGDELFGHAIEIGGLLPSALGLIGGALLFLGIDHIIEKRDGGESGMGLLASVTVDGVPENLALGVALIGQQTSAILALLVAICLANLPEALSGASEMQEEGHKRKTTLLLWGGVGVLLILAVILGNTLLSAASDELLAVVQSLAAGGVLASLAITLMPQAYHKSHQAVAFATVAGFLLTFALK